MPKKRTETFFSQLANQFLLIRDYAKENCDLFALIIVGEISAMTALQYINLYLFQFFVILFL